MNRDLKKDLIYSLTVLFTVANGLLGAMTIGITELIKYSKDDAVKASQIVQGTQEATQNTMEKGQNVFGDMQFVGCTLRDNKGWIFVILMVIGIIGIIIMNIFEYEQKKNANKRNELEMRKRL